MIVQLVGMLLVAVGAAVCTVASCDSDMASLASEFSCDTEDRCRHAMTAQVGRSVV